jgi:hypothetical protein
LSGRSLDVENQTGDESVALAETNLGGSMPRRILVTGGRSNYDWLTVEKAILEHCVQGDVIVHGAASGVDSLARQMVLYNPDFFTEDPFPAEWKVNGVYNANAGPERNKRMLESGITGALVFAGERGTADMVRQLKAAGVKFYDYSSWWMGAPRG